MNVASRGCDDDVVGGGDRDLFFLPSSPLPRPSPSESSAASAALVASAAAVLAASVWAFRTLAGLVTIALGWRGESQQTSSVNVFQ